MSGRTRTHCPHCGNAYPPRARFCQTCGRQRDQKSAAEMNTGRAATHAETLARFRSNGDITGVRILCAPDSCAACRRYAGDYTLASIPALPHAACSHPNGCRCTYAPITAPVAASSSGPRSATSRPAAIPSQTSVRPAKKSGRGWMVGVAALFILYGVGRSSAPKPSAPPPLSALPNDAPLAPPPPLPSDVRRSNLRLEDERRQAWFAAQKQRAQEKQQAEDRRAAKEEERLQAEAEAAAAYTSGKPVPALTQAENDTSRYYLNPAEIAAREVNESYRRTVGSYGGTSGSYRRTRRGSDSAPYNVDVRSYTRRDGTRVRAHTRRSPRR